MIEEKSSSEKATEDKETKKPASASAEATAGKPAQTPSETKAGEEEKAKTVEKVEKKEEAPKEEKKEEKAKEKLIKVPKHLKKIVEEIENLKVVDLATLVKVLEKKFGVSAMPTAVTAPPAPAFAEAMAGKEEKKFFNVSLTAVGEKKIEVIKAVRDITQRGLKESKDLVDKVAEGPQIIKENAKKEEAEEMKKKLEEAGAKVELK